MELLSNKLIKEILEQILEATEWIKRKCSYARCEDDFIDTEEGQEKLDSICIKLIAIGESLKNIDKITHNQLLAKYPEIEWKKIKGIRDFISHHYFDIDAGIIFDICQNHIDPLKRTIQTILKDIAIQ